MKINVFNRQRTLRVNLPWLRQIAELARQQCLPYSADQRFALRDLEEVEVSIVSDRVIADVHMRFMNIPGATDVITFEHGEIIMSAQTAQHYGASYGHSVDEELALYIVHGLLHLNGYEDGTAREATVMRRVQERILRACFELIPPL